MNATTTTTTTIMIERTFALSFRFVNLYAEISFTTFHFTQGKKSSYFVFVFIFRTMLMMTMMMDLERQWIWAVMRLLVALTLQWGSSHSTEEIISSVNPTRLDKQRKKFSNYVSFASRSVSVCANPSPSLLAVLFSFLLVVLSLLLSWLAVFVHNK